MDNISLSNFNLFYLYGFTDKPNQVAADKEKFAQLYSLVIGKTGGIAVSNSYHPYFVINAKGATVWMGAFLKILVNAKGNEVFDEILKKDAVVVVDTSTLYTEVNVWPDERLTYNENPLFSKFVPFIIPFLVKQTDAALNWDQQISIGMATNGHASDYVNKVTQAIRFFMPEPAFIIGFDEFDEHNPSKLIDSFINCKKMLGG